MHKLSRYYFYMTMFVILFPLSSFSDGPVFTFKSHGQTIKTVPFSEMPSLLSPQEITAWDPDTGTEIKWKGYDTEALFDKIYGKIWRQEEEMLFTCSDGYQPLIPAEQFKDYKGYLTFARLDQKEFSLVDINEHGKKVDLGPLYLVWDDIRFPELKNSDGTFWPFKLVSVDLTSFNERFPKIAPPQGSKEAVKRGFLAFQKNCLTCHSVNGQGGTQGPELNYPVNITEYYNLTWLKKWILNPTGTRFRTAMPGLNPALPHREKTVDDIISYLSAMKRAKIKPN